MFREPAHVQTNYLIWNHIWRLEIVFHFLGPRTSSIRGVPRSAYIVDWKNDLRCMTRSDTVLDVKELDDIRH